jgi:putative ABC transport system permease protein
MTMARIGPALLSSMRLSSSSTEPPLSDVECGPRSSRSSGVVENERFRGLELPSEPAVYLSTLQFAQTAVTLLIRTPFDTRAVMREVRASVRAIEPAATIGTPATLADILEDQLVARRVTADVIGGFSGAALALAALGVYGVLSMLVASRTREIGVRLALGASPAGIAGRIVGESIWNAAPGLVAGVVLAIVSGRLLEGFLVGVTGRDPATLTLVAATMLGTAVLAALIPAVRAARVDPAIALRGE